MRAFFAVLLLLSPACAPEQKSSGTPAPAGAQEKHLTYDWPSWGGDEGGQRFSPLDQINRGNVKTLIRAWTYHTGDVSDGTGGLARTTFECTPLVVDGVMYISTPFCRAIALDPETGRELWSFDPRIDKSLQRNWMLINRGVAAWKSGQGWRIFLGTMAGDLWCLDAATGKPVETFGQGGKVPHGYMGPNGRVLHGSEASPENLPTEWEGAITSAPAVIGDLVVVGGQLPFLRAYAALTGKVVWERSKILAPEDPDYASWEGPGLAKQGGSFSWAPISVDSQRQMIFVGADSPTPDFYGGERHGDNRPCNSILALDAATGKTIWQYQISHHDVWDYDIPSQPNLITVRREGREVPAVAVTTKQGLLFLFDRETGKPLFEIRERPVPQSRVPGEKLSPTQPFPVAPPPYARQGAGPDDLNRATPELEALARKAFSEYKVGRLYDPPSEQGVIVFPNTIGGGAWGGGCYDPRSGLYYVSNSNVGSLMKMVRSKENPALYARVTDNFDNGRFWDNRTRIPFTPPPWSTLSALDLNAGTLAWQSPLGIVESLAAQGITNTGSISIGGAIVTAGGLVFIGASNDSRFRAFDSATGAELWVAEIDGSGHAVPMTYLGRKTGKQFVVIAAGGGNKFNNGFADALVAFTLP